MLIAGLSRNVTSYLQPEAEAALEIEGRLLPLLPRGQDPEQRAHLLYRLSVIASRYRGDFKTGCELAERALTVARSGAIASMRAPYFEAWALNARALARFRLREREGARADCALALARLDAGADVPRAEVDLSRLVIADNLARLAAVGDNPDGAAHWQRVCESCMEALPEHRRPPMIWSYLNTASVDALAARRHFERQAERARRRLDPVAEAPLAYMAGNCAYRVGGAGALHRRACPLAQPR